MGMLKGWSVSVIGGNPRFAAPGIAEIALMRAGNWFNCPAVDHKNKWSPRYVAAKLYVTFNQTPSGVVIAVPRWNLWRSGKIICRAGRWKSFQTRAVSPAWSASAQMYSTWRMDPVHYHDPKETEYSNALESFQMSRELYQRTRMKQINPNNFDRE